MSILNNSNAISTGGGYNLENSLRFRSSASAYLSRTPGTAGNRKTFTYSAWVKRGTLGVVQSILSVGVVTASNPRVDWQFNASNSLEIDMIRHLELHGVIAWLHLQLKYFVTHQLGITLLLQ
jgi:hypothetical protein